MTTVTVTTAISLSAKQLATLTTQLEKKYGKIALEKVVDPQVLGGIKIRIGSQEFDATLKQKFESVKAQISAQW